MLCNINLTICDWSTTLNTTLGLQNCNDPVSQKIPEGVQFFCLSLESSRQIPRGGESLPLWDALDAFLDLLNLATSSPKTSPVLSAEMRSSNSPFCPLVRVPSREVSPLEWPLHSAELFFPRDLPTELRRLDACFRSIVRFLSCKKKLKMRL